MWFFKGSVKVVLLKLILLFLALAIGAAELGLNQEIVAGLGGLVVILGTLLGLWVMMSGPFSSDKKKKKS